MPIVIRRFPRKPITTVNTTGLMPSVAIRAATDPEPKDLEPILGQLDELSDQIMGYTIAADKYFGLAGTLSVAALGASLKSDGPSPVLDFIVIASPFALSFLLHYVSQLMTERAARVGVKRALEEEVGARVDSAYVRLESILNRSVGQKRGSVWVSMTLFALILLASFLASAIRVLDLRQSMSEWAPAGLLAAAILMVIALFVVILEMLRAEGISYVLTKAELTAKPS